MTSSRTRTYTAKRGIRNNGNGGGNHKPLPLSGHNLVHLHRSASQRGAVAAQLVLEEIEPPKPTVLQAAAITGANIPYVYVALRLTPETRARVAAGKLTLAKAAKANGLLAAWSTSTPAERSRAGAAVGVNEIWDRAIEPSI